MTPEIEALAEHSRGSTSPAVWQGVLTEIDSSSTGELVAYLHGAMHDGTYSACHGTLRIAQSDIGWLVMIRRIISRLGSRSWAYREGRRDIYVLESSLKLDPRDLTGAPSKAAYARGYFDAEGGVPRRPGARFYVQFCQKDRDDLAEVHDVLRRLGIECGRMHNPSVRVDPEYWRFFVRSAGQLSFAEIVSSWHPRKRSVLRARLGQLDGRGGPGAAPSVDFR